MNKCNSKSLLCVFFFSNEQLIVVYFDQAVDFTLMKAAIRVPIDGTQSLIIKLSGGEFSSIVKCIYQRIKKGSPRTMIWKI